MVKARPSLFVITAVVLMLLFDMSRAAFACGMDTSYCAETTERNGIYTGTLRDPADRPLANTEFEAHFETRGQVTFTTDERGRYCILWPHEAVLPSTQVAGASTGTSLGGWLPLEDAAPPPGCQTGDAGVPWHRAKDFTSSWQFLTLLSLAALALAALVAGAANWRDRGQLWARLSAGLTAVALVAHFALWAP
jgi:hypothetical protein